jgi:alkanesulfonate monooxygenase SsuD/methylene tetrahydromethanopterin reductase-like flavin-dependent oxidoreductase (luciferase family)
MRFGLALPHYGFSLPGNPPPSFETTAAWARRAEDLGFDSVWMSDHFLYSFARYGGDPAPIGSLEAMTTLAALTQVTERVRLGTLVLCAPFRHPAILARQARAVRDLSGDRVVLGLGAGWLEDEFDRFGFAFGTVGERFSALEATVEVLHDRAPEVPRFLGGKGGPRLLRLAARGADGWNVVWRVRPDRYAEQVEDVRAACEAEGRDPRTFRRTVGLYGTIGRDEAEARSAFERGRVAFPGDAMREETWESWRADTLSGSPAQVRDRVQAFADLGVEELILSPWVLPFSIIEEEQVERFAEHVVRAG